MARLLVVVLAVGACAPAGGAGPMTLLVQANLAAWCEAEPCLRLRVTDLATGDEVEVGPAYEGATFDVGASRFSLDGAMVAVPAGPDILVIDVRQHERLAALSSPSDLVHLAWSDEPAQLLWATSAFGGGPTQVGRWAPATDTTATRELRLGPTGAVVAVPRVPPEP